MLIRPVATTDDVHQRCDVVVTSSLCRWLGHYLATMTTTSASVVSTSQSSRQRHRDIVVMTSHRLCRLRFIDIVIATFSRCRRGHNDIDTSALWGSTAVAVPPPFRPSDPALCGSSPLVTPYCCRLGDLLCFVFIVWLLYVWCLYCMFLQYFDTVG